MKRLPRGVGVPTGQQTKQEPRVAEVFVHRGVTRVNGFINPFTKLTMNTSTNQLCLTPDPSATASRPARTESIAAFVHRLVGQVALIVAPAPSVAKASLDLLCRAEGYESTQSSYAADLRATALLAMGDPID